MKIGLTVRDWAGVVGMHPIVISLGFLILQMRQDEELSPADATINTLAVQIELNNSIISTIDIWAVGNLGETLTPTDSIKYERLLNTYEMERSI
jgi:hypothetical protein